MAPWRGQDAPVKSGGKDRVRNASEAASAWRHAEPAIVPTDAVDRKALHELRVNDENSTWRLVYRIDEDAIVILDVFSKKTPATPRGVIDSCKERLRRYEAAIKEGQSGQGEEG